MEIIQERKWVFNVLVIAALLGTFLHTSVSIALPAIMEGLSISASVAQWLNSGYSLVSGIILPLTAFLAKRFSTKRLFYTSSLILLSGLVLGSFANCFEILMLSRVLQAIGSSILHSLFHVTTMMIYPIEQRGKIIGTYGLLSGIVSVISPVITGMLIDNLGWHSIFSICFIVIIVDVILAIKHLRNCFQVVNERFDIISFILSVLGVLNLLLWIGNMGAASVFSTQMVLMLVTSIVSIVLFMQRQLKSETPFLDIKLLKVAQLRKSVICGALLHVIIMAVSAVMSIYLQLYRAIPATLTALIFIPGTLVMALVYPTAGKIYDKHGINKLLLVGAITTAVSSFIFGQFDENSSLVLIAILTLMRSVGIGMTINIIPIWGISTIKNEEIGSGNAIIQLTRTIAGSISSITFVAIATAKVSLTSDYLGNFQLLSGIQTAFLITAALGALLVGIALLNNKEKNNKDLI